MTEREVALEQALGAVVAVVLQLGISMTLLAKAKADLLLQASESEPAKQQVLGAVREIELAAKGLGSSLPIVPLIDVKQLAYKLSFLCAQAADTCGQVDATSRLDIAPSSQSPGRVRKTLHTPREVSSSLHASASKDRYEWLRSEQPGRAACPRDPQVQRQL